MKNILFRAASLALAISISALPTPTKSAVRGQSQNEDPPKLREAKLRSGPEVAARVRKLKEKNKDLKAALKVFERRGHTPKIDESSLITTKLSSSYGPNY